MSIKGFDFNGVIHKYDYNALDNIPDIETDKTLTIDGAPADAKATGDRIANLQALVGSPLTASTAAGMTDHSKIYVYVGSETGYTNGNWYYYDGSAWVSGGVYNSVAVDIDTTLTLSNKAPDSKVVGDAISSLNEDITNLNGIIDDISDDYAISSKEVTVDVDIDASDVRDGYTADQPGASMNVNGSSITRAIIRAFICEANKTYRLTITNGVTPAAIADRPTVVVSTPVTFQATVLWVQRSTNTSNATDVVEFTPTVSGYVYFNVDANYQSVSVTTVGTEEVTEKTANDKQAREDIETLKPLPNALSQLSSSVSTLSGSVDSISETCFFAI